MEKFKIIVDTPKDKLTLTIPEGFLQDNPGLILHGIKKIKGGPCNS